MASMQRHRNGHSQNPCCASARTFSLDRVCWTACTMSTAMKAASAPCVHAKVSSSPGQVARPRPQLVPPSRSASASTCPRSNSSLHLRASEDWDQSPAHDSKPSTSERCSPLALPLAGIALACLHPEAASALQLEPANALSLPTWAIHVSSVAEWVIAMSLMWRYAEVSGNPLWKGMTWGMLPALGSASCACIWHFFYNSPDLEFLVALQAFLTCVANVTCAIAAFRIWQDARSPTAS